MIESGADKYVIHKKALEESQGYSSSRYNDEIEKTETADFSKHSAFDTVV